MGATSSVAMCTHNGAAFVEQQVASILGQSVLPAELVVSDDASSDATIGIVRSMFDALSPNGPAAGVRLIVLENPVPLGITANFEQAIRATSGEVIFLSDQDDVWHADRVESALQVFDADPSLSLVFSDADLVDVDGASLGIGLFEALEIRKRELESIRQGDAFSVLVKRNVVTGATVAFRRVLLDVALPFPPEWVHDEWLATLAAGTSRIGVIDRELIDYRQHGANEIGVRRATLAVKVGQVFQPRGNRNEWLASRSRLLSEHLESLVPAVSLEVLAQSREKATVEKFRAALPASRWRRIAPMIVAERRGWYARYCSQGRLDILRDLLQPHG